MGIAEHDRAVEVRDVVADRLPGYRIETVAMLGAGQDNVAYLVNGELIVRFGKESDPRARAARIDTEARLLAAVARVSPVPVPEPAFVVAAQGCLAYFAVPGVPLIELSEARRALHANSIAETLGRFLGALHAVPTERFADLVEVDMQPPEQWLVAATECYESAVGEIPHTQQDAVERFLATPPPAEPYEPVFSHNDLGIEHVLVQPDSGAVTGIIDWSDAAITDPAYDFGLIHRDLGVDALDIALRAYGIGDQPRIRARARFYAVCSALEDMAYGLETGDHRYLGNGRTALERLLLHP
ncbi:phosphotransferase family protein [Nocardia sp. alder85J]|uniref:phosphotransferase family protein n=1 Tax=Nocardia sp. alder85J TaxID=2862949 RepID=UPI001CD740A8|nr:aminoglycoside phosphotransferase family protein [Nocardia sp. alder85J]MCX4094418.1 aminoglycoside phosphotransferase family protein [Nocardia sp. alder85J]